MSPASASTRGVWAALPRASGGVSNATGSSVVIRALPRASGGVSLHTDDARTRAALPRASGGVLPGSATCCPSALPRASGGVSHPGAVTDLGGGPSPRERGCLLLDGPVLADVEPFPARAGVSPRSSRMGSPIRTLPRASGGVSARPPAAPSLWEPFPARAGVSPRDDASPGRGPTLPRASGGVSPHPMHPGLCHAPSPRERGCLPPQDGPNRPSSPFPARAGVSPPCRRRLTLLCLESSGEGVELAEDLARDVALEAAADLASCSALGGAALDVGAGGGVVGHADPGDDVQGAVELAVPTAG